MTAALTSALAVAVLLTGSPQKPSKDEAARLHVGRWESSWLCFQAPIYIRITLRGGRIGEEIHPAAANVHQVTEQAREENGEDRE